MQDVKGKLNIKYGIKIIEPVKNNFIGSFFLSQFETCFLLKNLKI